MSKFRSHTQDYRSRTQKRLAAEKRETRCLGEHKRMGGYLKQNSAERIGYDKPIDAQSVKLTLSSRGVEKFEANYNALHE